ncbi:bifunctional metallophosphatase/5'-nucleotidase [Alkalicoccus daliensis]|uniref:2',3'-cyclic-nucleotide 2'-phosphodiesterase / 3'-nucleotidase / 5'-nucleotidase n=1 Tax=Alkalicoccus daliensis TaxID=745820 RepID=A0A1G9ZE25_9BACI|nr:5'-nucleotidase C-terminal domain-containing protein [Alkalicoccus daliensis]SDN19211.1 2',3'-cyclic-nucleotide 2'-phosphodiesterase / 3'-nucleotidase / 5'-nucleotidase [Alkalicoccus daliensis]
MKFKRSTAGLLAVGILAATGTVAADGPGKGNGPKRSVEDTSIIDSSSFSVSFDKTFPAGQPLERIVDVEFTDTDGNQINAGDLEVEVTSGNRSEVTVTHEDLDGQTGTLTVGDTELAFDHDTFDLNIFHTNDNHGRTDAYPQLVSAYNEAQDTYGEGLLLDAGDIFSGTLYFNEFRGQDAVEFMNYMGYDAFVPGNHEFDLGDPDEGHPELVEFFEAADFPIVAANIDFSGDSGFDHLNQGGISNDPQAGNIYDGIILEQDGEQIGIFGLDTENTVNISSPMNVTFSNYLAAAEQAVADFEAQGIDKIVALTHLGYDSSPAIGSDLLLAANVEGIDAIIGGHSHTTLEEPVIIDTNADGAPKDPTIIGQANEYGKFLGVMNLTFDSQGRVVDYAGELLAAEDYEADPTAAEMLEPYTEAVEELQNQPAGSYVVNELPNPRLGADSNVSVRANETALGNLIADAQLDAALTASDEVLMAVQNGGGIRAPIAAGDVTVGELITVQPFGNRLSLMEITGEELYEAFEHSFSNYPEENGGFLQISEGTEVTFDSTEEPGDRVESIIVDGEEIAQDSEMYTIAMNNFTAAGGDGYDVFSNIFEDDRVSIVGFTDWEMLRDYMADLGEVDYSVEGRITDIADE